MTNETLQTIRSRRSCRAYEPRQITDAELDAVLEAGTYAASAKYPRSHKKAQANAWAFCLAIVNI